MAFCLAIAKHLISGFSYRKRAGRPHSADYDDLHRLNTDFGHWPISVDEKGDRTASAKIGHIQNLPRSEW